MTTATATREDLMAMATIPLTRPGGNTVPVRMQTEHLAAVESDLGQRGVPVEIVAKYFLGLHRCDELPLELWIGMITDAYNLATATATAPSYVAALAIEWAANDTLERWVNAGPNGPGTLASAFHARRGAAVIPGSGGPSGFGSRGGVADDPAGGAGWAVLRVLGRGRAGAFGSAERGA